MDVVYFRNRMPFIWIYEHWKLKKIGHERIAKDYVEIIEYIWYELLENFKVYNIFVFYFVSIILAAY